MTLTREQRKILNTLIDKYERSASFRGNTRRAQHFSIKPEELYPKYLDEREYDFFVRLNQDIYDLKRNGYVTVSEINMRITKVTLENDRLSELYTVLGREPKGDILSSIKGFLVERKGFLNSTEYENDAVSDALLKYISEQEKRLEEGKLPEYYDGSVRDGVDDYKDFWKALEALLDVKDEIYIRDISVRLFNDSKRLEQLSGRVSGCLYKYGDYPEKSTVLEECGIIHTPSYVMVRGSIEIHFGEQLLDVGKLTGDIAFSTETLKGITSVRVYGRRVITIENLTSFHGASLSPDEVAIYLGGYHSRSKRAFLRMIYSSDTTLDFYHFGDIDAGGFYIYEHLRRRTGIPFRTLKMDKEMLVQYSQFTKSLSGNDITRINRLIQKYKNEYLDSPDRAEIIETLEYMLDNNIKLEQEAGLILV